MTEVCPVKTLQTRGLNMEKNELFLAVSHVLQTFSRFKERKRTLDCDFLENSVNLGLGGDLRWTGGCFLFLCVSYLNKTLSTLEKTPS